MELILKVFEKNYFLDGNHVEYLVYPEIDLSNMKKFWNYKKTSELEKSEKKIIYEDGSEFILPISESVEVLPDRTGFMVIYGKEPSGLSKEKKYPWFFEQPSNAAIYNADGSLRCQIKSPWKDGYFLSFEQPSMKSPNLPSIILNHEDNPHDNSFYDLYAVDINTGVLLKTGQQIRR